MKSLILLFILPVFILSCSKSGTSYVNNPGAPEYLHTRPVGASAKELLSAEKYTSVKIEILYMAGYAPDNAALDLLRSFLADHLNKPGGISIVTKEIPASSRTTMSVNDIIDIEKTNRTVFTTENQLAVSVVYTNGNYVNQAALGIAYRNTSMAVFGKTVNDNSGAIGQVSRTKLEATILQHEMGHLLGLVDLGSEMQAPHKDNDHGNHCTVTNCLMYYTAETTDILGFLLTGNVPALDGDCRADLVANGGR